MSASLFASGWVLAAASDEALRTIEFDWPGTVLHWVAAIGVVLALVALVDFRLPPRRPRVGSWLAVSADRLATGRDCVTASQSPSIRKNGHGRSPIGRRGSPC